MQSNHGATLTSQEIEETSQVISSPTSGLQVRVEEPVLESEAISRVQEERQLEPPSQPSYVSSESKQDEHEEVAATSHAEIIASVSTSSSPTSTLLSTNATLSSFCLEQSASHSLTNNNQTNSSLSLTSSIEINAATPSSVILPTLIETAEVQGEEAAVIPTVVTTTDSGDQTTQQLSFPDVSQQNEEESIAVIGSERVVDGVVINMSDPVPTTISDDPLRTPPRPEIEDRTSATGKFRHRVCVTRISLY